MGVSDNEGSTMKHRSKAKMKKEAKIFLDFVHNNLNPNSLSLVDWKRYLDQLPQIYNEDISFRLLFDWHWDRSMRQGKAWFNPDHPSKRHPSFEKQIALISLIGKQLYNLDYQYRELILCHARCDLKGKTLLEIGGSLPNDLLFEQLEIDSYINIESPDYIEAESGLPYTEKHGAHERRETIFCNAEDVSKKVGLNSVDTIFSVACFEHIYDLPSALEACYSCSKKGGTLFSYFAPIYSQIAQGDHGVIPQHQEFPQKPIGFHLLAQDDQRKKLIDSGFTNPKDIQDFLGRVNFDRVPNRLFCEDYERICTESPYVVLELDRQECFNLSKSYANEFKEVRASNEKIQNMMTIGFRVYLIKP